MVVFDQTFSSNSQLHKVLSLAIVYVQVFILSILVRSGSIFIGFMRPLSFCLSSAVLVSRIGLAKDCVNILLI